MGDTWQAKARVMVIVIYTCLLQAKASSRTGDHAAEANPGTAIQQDAAKYTSRAKHAATYSISASKSSCF